MTNTISPASPEETESLLPSAETERRSASHIRHGHTKGRVYSPTYHSWQAMLSRCRYLARDEAAKHAGRGIAMAPRWLSFEAFLSDMGERPAGTTLDREDNDGDYTPANCRWATPIEQARNRRNAKMTFERAYEACLRLLAGETAKAVASAFGCSESLPREIVKGRSWADASAAAHRDWSRTHD